MFNFGSFFKALGIAGLASLWLIGGGVIGSQVEQVHGETAGLLAFAGYTVFSFAVLIGFATRND